jgi:hypothetical protein
LKQDLAELSQDIPIKKPKLESSASSSSSSSPRSLEVKDRNERDRLGSDKAKSAVTDVVKDKPRERLREIEEDIFFGPVATLSSNRAKDRERSEREEREKATAKLKEKELKEKKELVPAIVAPVVPTVAASDDSGSETEVSGDDTVEGDIGDEDNMDEVQFEFLGSLSCVICK